MTRRIRATNVCQSDRRISLLLVILLAALPSVYLAPGQSRTGLLGVFVTCCPHRRGFFPYTPRASVCPVFNSQGRAKPLGLGLEESLHSARSLPETARIQILPNQSLRYQNESLAE